MFFTTANEFPADLLPSVHRFPKRYIASISELLSVTEINSVLRLVEENSALEDASAFFKDFSPVLLELGIGSSKQICFSNFLAHALIELLPNISDSDFQSLGDLVFLEQNDFEKINASRQAWYSSFLKI